MKNPMVRTHTLTTLAARLVAIVSFAAFLSAAPFHAALAATAPDLGTAGSFAVLAGSAVTLTDSVVIGDVGVYSGTAVTQTNSHISGTVHAGDTVAQQAYQDFGTAYAALASVPCTVNLSGQLLAGQTLTPGVYCFEAAVTETGGVLTLNGPSDGVWIFKIGTLGTGALTTSTNFSVVMSGGGTACNVYWWVAQAATLTASNFQGTILAGADTTFTGGSLIGRDLAKGAVTLTGVTVSSCSPGTAPTVCKDFVTGGGWIMLPSGSTGTFGVTGGIKQGKLWGDLTYVDHGLKGSKVQDMKVKGTGVTAYTVVDAVTRHIEGTAEINGKAGYTYQVDVADRGEPGRDDTFSLQLSNGYTASGKLAGGNIQLHKKCRPLICPPCDKDDDEHEGCDGHKDHHDRR